MVFHKKRQVGFEHRQNLVDSEKNGLLPLILSILMMNYKLKQIQMRHRNTDLEGENIKKMKME